MCSFWEIEPDAPAYRRRPASATTDGKVYKALRGNKIHPSDGPSRRSALGNVADVIAGRDSLVDGLFFNIRMSIAAPLLRNAGTTDG